jgi:hypothetical protein
VVPATLLRTLVLSGVAGVVLLGAPPATAYSARLSWAAPDVCPGTDALRQSVERLLGEPLADGAGAEATATVTADPDERFTLTLTLRTEKEEGARRLRTETCESALEVAAFGIALALNPELAAEPPSVVTWPVEPDATAAPPAPTTPPPPEPERAPAVVARPPAPPVDRPPPRPAPARAWGELWAAAFAVGDSSLLPGPALGVGLSVEALLLRRLRLGAGPLLFLPQQERLGNGAGGLFSLWSLQGYACGVLVAGLDVCPLFHYGVLRGEGRGVTPRLEQVSRVYAPGAAVLGSYSLARRILARAGASVLFPVARDSFVVRNGLVHRSPRASFEFSLGIATRAF